MPCPKDRLVSATNGRVAQAQEARKDYLKTKLVLRNLFFKQQACGQHASASLICLKIRQQRLSKE
jgi:hypothetical protein